MSRTLLARSVILVALTVLHGCFHRAQSGLRIGDQVSPPRGLDSAATAKWVETQRAACPGRLRFLVDEGVIAADTSRVARYHQSLAAVQCVAP